MQEIVIPPYASLAGADPGRIVAFDIGVDGFPYAVIATGPLDDRTVSPGGASFPKIRPETPQGYQIYRLHEGEAQLLTAIEREAFNIHHVQPLGEDQLLLACARCEHRKDRPDRNGRIYHTHGRIQGAITLGDGIQNIAVTPDGLIWTSYFDEGVFGNFGWSKPLGNNGLVAWRQDGTIAYKYQPSEGLDFICDCYAMNACGNEIWIYYYTDFPLVLIRDGAVMAHWEVPVKGADAFAISRGYALFRGGYDQRDDYLLLGLTEPTVRQRARFRLKSESGTRIKAQRVSGRGDAIFLLQDREIFRITVEEAKRSLGLRPQ